RELLDWPSFDGFFNACLLRRPARRYVTNTPQVVRLEWADVPGRVLDPGLITQLRYFSRDAVLPGEARSTPPTKIYTDPSQAAFAPVSGNEEEAQRLAVAKADSGIAGWNDFGLVANIARTKLKQAAGIKVPKREFVFQVLAVYLAVLVPLNWLVFRV